MADVEPVDPGALVPRDATGVVLPPRRAVGPARRRTVLASRVRALTTTPLLPASALAVAAWAAARVAIARSRATPGPGPGGPVDRVAGPRAPGATVGVSWTHVEVRWRG